MKGDKNFERDGIKIWTEVHMTYPRLVLGGEEDVRTLEGETAALSIPAGTQVGAVLRIAGKGLPRTNGNVRGDLFVRVRMEVPTRASEEEKEILRQLDDKVKIIDKTNCQSQDQSGRAYSRSDFHLLVFGAHNRPTGAKYYHGLLFQ